MKHLFAHLGFPMTAGVHVAGRKAHITLLALTAWGPRELNKIVIELAEDVPDVEQIGAALDVLGVHTVALSLPATQCYLTTRPVAVGAASISPRVLLRESMRSASPMVDSMAADTAPLRPGKRELVTIAGCPRDAVTAFVEESQKRNWRLEVAEPAPFSLLRQVKQNRGTKGPHIHIFLNSRETLSIVSCNQQVLLWNLTRLSQGDEAALLLSQIRSLQSMAAPTGLELPIQHVFVHGRTELRPLLDVAWLEAELQLTLKWQNDPVAGPEQYATGAALGLATEAQTINLARDYHRKAKFREIFPWRELVIYAAMFLAMAGVLRMRQNEILASSSSLISTASTKEMVQSSRELEQQRSQLRAHVANVKEFTDGRVAWTACLREVASSLPPSVALTSIAGDAPLKAKRGKAKGPKRVLVLKGTVVLRAGGLIPHEIDMLLEALRDNPVLAEQFANVELADLKQFQNGVEAGEFAMFTVICTPRIRGTSNA